MHYAITKQIAPLAAPGTRTSQINRVFNAALGEFLDLHVHGGSPYAQLYEKYMNIAPRFRPRSSDCDPWVAPEDADDALQTMLRRGVIRFGYVPGIPYVYRDDHETLTGFDYELGETLAAIIGTHYHGHPERLRAEWVEVTLTGGDDQADKLGALYKGLTEGTFDLALSGQMMLPESYLGGLPIEWTAPTAILFTAITWTGLHRDRLDIPAMRDFNPAICRRSKTMRPGRAGGSRWNCAFSAFRIPVPLRPRRRVSSMPSTAKAGTRCGTPATSRTRTR